MNEEKTQIADGAASVLNAELGFNIGDAVTVLLHGDDNEYTGTVTNPKKLWVELHDYGRPFISDECSIKTIKLKYTFNDAIFKSDEVTVKKKDNLISIEIYDGICNGILLTKKDAILFANAIMEAANKT